MILTVVPPPVVPDVGVNDEMVGSDGLKVYLSAVPDVAVPPAVVTWTFTAPATWGLVLARTTVGDVTVNDVAVVAPNLTAVAPKRFVPVILTVVPPLVVPDAGVSEEIVGNVALNVYLSAVPDVAVPPAVVTWTLTVPATWGLVLARTTVGLVTVKDVAVVAPNLTAVAPKRFAPVILTVVPPLVVPDVGVREEMVGLAALKVYLSPVPDAAVPPAVVTWTLTAPAMWGSVTALMVVGLVTV